MSNQMIWLDLPVLDLDRAIHFYSKVLDGDVLKQTVEGLSFGLLPHAQTSVSGCLVLAKPEEINEEYSEEVNTHTLITCDGEVEKLQKI